MPLPGDENNDKNTVVVQYTVRDRAALDEFLKSKQTEVSQRGMSEFGVRTICRGEQTLNLLFFLIALALLSCGYSVE